MSRMYLVKAVRGEMVLNPATIGHAQKHFVGHQRVERGTRVDPRVDPNPKKGNPNQTVPHYAFDFIEDAEPELVSETSDFHVKQAITKAGALEYIETVDHFGTDRERRYVEPEILAASDMHMAARAVVAAKAEPTPTSKSSKVTTSSPTA